MVTGLSIYTDTAGPFRTAGNEALIKHSLLCARRILEAISVVTLKPFAMFVLSQDQLCSRACVEVMEYIALL